jgi:hypothetical protein
MVAPNYSYRAPRTAVRAMPRTAALADRLRRYFDQHSTMSRDDFLIGALQHEIDARQPLTIDDVRIHAWLVERQAVLDRERSGWQAKAKRLFHLDW